MSDLPYVYAAAVAVLAGLAAVAVQSRRPLRFRLAALALGVAALAAAWAGFADLLGRAKPAAWEFAARGIDDYEVLHAEIRPGASIHLLLRVPGLREPRLYALPWRPGIAERLEDALARAEAEQLVPRASSDLFESDIEDRERVFHAIPVAALPPKDSQRFEPTRFVPDESNTMFGAGEPDG